MPSESYLAQWSARTGTTVETWALPATGVSPRVTRGVLTVVREALSNAERHSGAGSVSIAVTVGQGGLRLTISDNGTGFNTVSDGGQGGRGIAGMRAALAELGGGLSVNGVPGQGTTVSGWCAVA
ncbi:sensor histidine kinase [Nonomuraea sp. NPDC002799]